ncbi:DUF6232 family protein [Limnofasciculus baicalensis]|uniref:DUF6232 family protein n=1 Tax=Limnofasciculus baicalensis BBK-W-15 TaxID=2699891 RepID=A0AAE3GZT3_9CYAN|nr:DUF6232 family protein [Limnofasciculus baicalensis]MCP2731632.1 DUF6232 family protein [Limnofasciculus baicalensis BBK-W-15]
MVLDSFLQPPDKTAIAKSGLLHVTKKSVKFGDNVYQFRNVTGFGIGEVKSEGIPILFILGLFLFGGILATTNNLLVGVIVISIAIGCTIWNIIRPKLYGLTLYLNSGDSRIFITSDTNWLNRAVSKLYDFIENAQEGSYLSITVGGNIEGNIIGGDVGGNVSSKKLRQSS